MLGNNQHKFVSFRTIFLYLDLRGGKGGGLKENVGTIGLILLKTGEV